MTELQKASVELRVALERLRVLTEIQERQAREFSETIERLFNGCGCSNGCKAKECDK